MNLFADDTSIQQKLTDLTSFSPIKRDLERLSKYGNNWLLKFNATKTEYMIVSKKRSRTNYPNLYLNGTNITVTEHHTHLGVTISNNLSWSTHISAAIAKADKRLTVIRRCRHILPRGCTETLYKTMIRTIFDYGDVLYDSCLKLESDSLEKFQRKAALICTGAFRITSHERL